MSQIFTEFHTVLQLQRNKIDFISINFCMLMEYCDGTPMGVTLDDNLDYRDSRKPQWGFVEKVKKENGQQKLEGTIHRHQNAKTIKQILHAVAILHSQNIVHRDIKPQNIYYKKGQDPVVNDDPLLVDHNGEIVLGDFGCAIQLDSTFKYEDDDKSTAFQIAPNLIKMIKSNKEERQFQTQTLKTRTQAQGSAPYLDEYLRMAQISGKKLSKSDMDMINLQKQDVYATGLVLFQLCCKMQIGDRKRYLRDMLERLKVERKLPPVEEHCPLKIHEHIETAMIFHMTASQPSMRPTIKFIQDVYIPILDEQLSGKRTAESMKKEKEIIDLVLKYSPQMLMRDDFVKQEWQWYYVIKNRNTQVSARSNFRRLLEAAWGFFKQGQGQETEVEFSDQDSYQIEQKYQKFKEGLLDEVSYQSVQSIIVDQDHQYYQKIDKVNDLIVKHYRNKFIDSRDPQFRICILGSRSIDLQENISYQTDDPKNTYSHKNILFASKYRFVELKDLQIQKVDLELMKTTNQMNNEFNNLRIIRKELIKMTKQQKQQRQQMIKQILKEYLEQINIKRSLNDNRTNLLGSQWKKLHNFNLLPSLNQIINGIFQEGKCLLAKKFWNQFKIQDQIADIKKNWNEFMEYEHKNLPDRDSPLTKKILHDPNHAVTFLLLYLYQMDSFLQSELNRACKFEDQSKVESLGPYSAALFEVIENAQQYQTNLSIYDHNNEQDFWKGWGETLKDIKGFTKSIDKKAFGYTYKIGKKVHFHGFTSCSLSKSAALNLAWENPDTGHTKILFHIKWHSKKHAYFQDVGADKDKIQQEIILTDGIGFIVESVEKIQQGEGAPYTLINLSYKLDSDENNKSEAVGDGIDSNVENHPPEQAQKEAHQEKISKKQMTTFSKKSSTQIDRPTENFNDRTLQNTSTTQIDENVGKTHTNNLKQQPQNQIPQNRLQKMIQMNQKSPLDIIITPDPHYINWQEVPYFWNIHSIHLDEEKWEPMDQYDCQQITLAEKVFKEMKGDPAYRFKVLGMWTLDVLQKKLVLTIDPENSDMFRMYTSSKWIVKRGLQTPINQAEIEQISDQNKGEEDEAMNQKMDLSDAQMSFEKQQFEQVIQNSSKSFTEEEKSPKQNREYKKASQNYSQSQEFQKYFGDSIKNYLGTRWQEKHRRRTTIIEIQIGLLLEFKKEKYVTDELIKFFNAYPGKKSDQISSLDLKDPESIIVRFLILLYSKAGLVYSRLNQCQRDQDDNKIYTLGPLAFCLGEILRSQSATSLQFKAHGDQDFGKIQKALKLKVCVKCKQIVCQKDCQSYLNTTKKNSVFKPITIYRGALMPNEIIKLYEQVFLEQKGKNQQLPISLKGFISASISRSVAESEFALELSPNDPDRQSQTTCLYIIKWTQDKNYFFLGCGYTEYEYEQEFLINEGQLFIITNIYDGVKKYHTAGYPIKIIELTQFIPQGDLSFEKEKLLEV